MSSLVRVAGPEAMAIDRADVKAHLRAIPGEEGGSPQDPSPADAAYVDLLIGAAVDRLDGPHGLLNRALISQQWRMLLPCFAPEIAIPLARCIKVNDVTYLDTSRNEVTVDPAAYRVLGLGTDRARLSPAASMTWPRIGSDPEAVQITFTSGFGDAATDVPGSIRLAILEMVATAYSYRENVIAGAVFSSLPAAASRVVTDWTSWPP